MGFFSRFLKEPETRQISVKGIGNWIDKEADKLQDEAQIINNEIRSKRIKIKEYLKELEDKVLENPDVIPDRARTIFYDNKKQYVAKTERFLDSLHPPEKSLELKKYLEALSDEITSLGEDTKRNFFITKEFLNNEMSQISKKIQDLEKTLSKGIQYFEKEKTHVLHDVHELLKKYEEEILEIERLRSDVEKIEEVKLELYSRKDKMLDKIKDIKKSPLFVELNEINDKLKDVEDKFSVEEKKFRALISDIEAAAKKFSKSNKTVIVDYLNDPINALIKDTKYSLKDAAGKLKSKIDSLDLKEAKKDKTLKVIERIEKFNPDRLRDLHEQKSVLVNRQRNNSATLNIKEIQGRIDQVDESINIENKKIAEIHHRLERLNPRLTLQKVRDKIKEKDPYTELKL